MWAARRRDAGDESVDVDLWGRAARCDWGAPVRIPVVYVQVLGSACAGLRQSQNRSDIALIAISFMMHDRYLDL